MSGPDRDSNKSPRRVTNDEGSPSPDDNTREAATTDAAGREQPRPDATLTVDSHPDTNSSRPSSLVSNASNQQTTVTHGRFQIIHEHASGGLGRVSLACDQKLGRNVALKEIRPDRRGNEQLCQRFVAEATITSRLEHPGIIPVYTMDEDSDGQPYYAMRFIEGRTLGDVIEAHHRQPTPLTFRELLQHYVYVCQTIAYAHSKGVVHRDLKPANIMIGDFGETLVLDWGLAKQLPTGNESASLADKPETSTSDSSHSSSATGSALETMDFSPGGSSTGPVTEVGQVLGTVAYMSPEQAAGRPVGPASDIYALGAILYQILTNEPPYGSECSNDALSRLLAGPPPPPSERGRIKVKPLEAICLRAIARLPKERYDSSLDLAADVEQWLADQPVSVYRDPPSVRVRRWVQRNRTLVTAAAALLVTAVISLAVGIVWVKQEQKQTQAALAAEAERRQETREALDLMSSAMIDEWLLKQSDLTDEHREFLQTALRYYEEFAADTGFDASVRAGTAAASRRVADIRQSLGDTTAEEAYLRSLTLYQDLLHDFPDSIEYRKLSAEAEHALGKNLNRNGQTDEALQRYAKSLEDTQTLSNQLPNDDELSHQVSAIHYSMSRSYFAEGKFDRAEASLREAEKIDRRLLARQPEDTSRRYNLSSTLSQLALTLSRRDNFSDAEACYLDSINILSGLVEQFPNHENYVWHLSVAYNDLGVLHKVNLDYENAEANYKKAMPLRQKLVREYPNKLEYAVMLGGSYVNQANLQRIRGSVEDALQTYDKGVETLDRVVQRDENHARGRKFLRNMLEGRAESYFLLKQFDRAIDDWDQSIFHNDHKGLQNVFFNARLRMRRLAARVHLGEVKQSVEDAESLVEESVGLAKEDASYYAAAVLAAAVTKTDNDDLSDRFAQRACELLEFALQAGFQGCDVKGRRFDEDEDHEPLFGHVEFQRLRDKYPK